MRQNSTSEWEPAGGGTKSRRVKRFSVHFLVTGALVFLAACGSTNAAQQATSNPGYNQLPSNIKSSGTITEAADLDYPPYEFLDANGNKTGFEVELAQALAADLGVKLNIQKVVFDSIVPGIASGRYDMSIAGITDTAAREKVVDFVDYFKLAEGLIVKAGNPGNLNTQFPGYCGHSFLQVVGSVELDRVHTMSTQCTTAGNRAMSISAAPSTAEQILGLQAGRAEAALQSKAANAYAAKQTNGQLEALPGIVLTGTSTSAGQAGIAIKKGSSLVQALKIALDDLIRNGKYVAILTKWGVSEDAVTQATVDQPSTG